jgi:hypothetical protein
VIGNPVDEDGKPILVDGEKVELMDMDPANFIVRETPPPMGDVCDLFGKPVALQFDYIIGATVKTGQDPKKATIIFDSGAVDEDGKSYIIVTDEDDPTKAFAGAGKRFFEGEVYIGETFKANDDPGSFSSNTYIHFFDSMDGKEMDDQGLLQSISYHTSCSQPIQIGDVIGNATLVGYLGENGGYPVPAIV